MKVITAKAKGAHVTLKAEPEHRDANVVNLMERLRQSLETRTSTKAGKAASAADSKRNARSKTAGKKTAGSRAASSRSRRTHAA